MFVPPLAERAMQHLVDIPLGVQQFIGPPFPLLVLGVPGVFLYQQGVDLRRQRLGRGQLGDAMALKN